MTLRRTTWCWLCFLVFAVSFAVRITAIEMFPQYDHHDDIEIYRASGALIVRGINPYDFSDHISVRTLLREQSPNPDMRNLSQARWDYYASSNLPMNLLFFGALNAISDSPLPHRYAYGFFDSLLSVLVVWFVLRHWPAAPGYLGAAFSQAGLSPNAALFADWESAWRWAASHRSCLRMERPFLRTREFKSCSCLRRWPAICPGVSEYGFGEGRYSWAYPCLCLRAVWRRSQCALGNGPWVLQRYALLPQEFGMSVGGERVRGKIVSFAG